MRKNGESSEAKNGMKRIIVRVGVALLLGVALFAGMALAGAPASQPRAAAPAVHAVSPDMLRQRGGHHRPGEDHPVPGDRRQRQPL